MANRKILEEHYAFLRGQRCVNSLFTKTAILINYLRHKDTINYSNLEVKAKRDKNLKHISMILLDSHKNPE